MSTDWNALADRAYILPTDITLFYDGLTGAGINTKPHVFGGVDWTGGAVALSARTNATLPIAASSYSDRASTGAAHSFRVDNTLVKLALFNYGASVLAGTITTDGSGTSYNSASDYRLKEDLLPIADPVAQLMALRPLDYRWIANGRRAWGFIAHEFGAIVPGGTSGEKDALNAKGEIEPQQMDAAKAVPLLVAAMQALAATIEQQQTRIAALEAGLEAEPAD